MNNAVDTTPHLNLTNPQTGDSLRITPEMFTKIWEALDRDPSTLDLSITLGDWADNQGFPIA